jgi:hypothetical protein
VVGRAPPVVDDPVGDRVEVAPEQRGQREVVVPLAAVWPFDVVPQYVGREQLVVPAEPEQVGVGLDRREVRGVPVEGARVVDAEAGARRAGGVVQLLNQVAAGAAADRVEGRRRRVPQAEALVVLRRRDDVAGARADQLGDEGVRVERFGAPQVREVLVRGADAERALVPLPRGRAGDADGVAVPLGVLVVRVRILRRDAAGAVGRGPGGRCGG